MNRSAGMNAGQIIGTMNGRQVVGLDIAKHVFQLHTVDMGTGEVINVQLKRAKVMEHFARRQPCLIAMEACGGAHHWARELTALGHSVRLLHAKIVRPFVSGNKTDATDARAIWLAVQQPGVKFVGIKTAAQQATLTLHRQRELLMKMRTMQTNALRGLLYEFGATFARGRNALFEEVEQALEELSPQLPQMVRDSLHEQVARIKAAIQDIQTIEKRLGLQLKADPQMRRIAQIPGVGLLTATAAIAIMGDASAFKSGREFCAWLGLVPSQTGTGGKVRASAASPNEVTRTCAPCSFTGPEACCRTPRSLGRGSKGSRAAGHVVIVAQAAKMARTIWAVTAKQQDYQRGFQSLRPQAA
ncbi:IS110 family transposase [Variovorax ureilyticus]|uniref:IS110 family transposase n=1 Tax=Variovorax ureilyticus TaxID=1836198 RepID=A0ABU8VSR2_9BURK